MKQILDEKEIRKTINLLKPESKLFEVRVIGTQSGRKKVLSGYFRDADTLLTELHKWDLQGTNVYITLNTVNAACFSKAQSNHFEQNASATSDPEIDSYEWLFIDLDPVRITGISSSDEEFKRSTEMASKVCSYLRNLGWAEPIKAVSGNGCHILYQISLTNTPENVRLVERCLKVLANTFNDDFVHVDTSNYNPSRICKLHGTLAQKGTDTEERPYRMSRIFGAEGIGFVSKVQLQELASELPEEVRPERRSFQPFGEEFDIESWMQEHGIRYDRKSGNDCTIYPLEECPFNHSHRNGDSKIFKYNNGAISFKCHHNSCQGKKWQDVRELLEPGAYEYRESDEDDARIEAGWKQHNRTKQNIQYEPKDTTEEDPDEPMFLNAKMINALPVKESEYIRTGITEIDRWMKGLEKTKVTLISGCRGASKSTILSEIGLNAIEYGHTVLYYSGELPKHQFMRWMYLQAAGKNHTIRSKKFENTFYVPDDTKDKIAEWLGDRLWLYNNDYGNNFKTITSILPGQIKRTRADLVILDNLMALDISSLDRDKYEAQTAFVLMLANIAKLTNTHIIFVAHPRKAMGFLRLDDVSGTGNLANAVDNAIIVHRNNADFRRLSQQAFGWKDGNEVYDGTNVIEIAKNREDGIQDKFIPLWYEPESKRLKNYEDENIIYGWEQNQDDDGFVPDDDENPFTDSD